MARSLTKMPLPSTRPEYSIFTFLGSTPCSFSSHRFKSLTLSVPVSGILTSFPVLESLILILVALFLLCCFLWWAVVVAPGARGLPTPSSCVELSGSLSSSSLCSPGTAMLVGLLMQYLGMTYLLPSSSYASVKRPVVMCVCGEIDSN